jgi:hypothetical protein
VGCQDRSDRVRDQPGELTAGERAELQRLRRETVELRSEVEIQREILRKAATWFAQEMKEGRIDPPVEGWPGCGTSTRSSGARHD